MKICLKSSKKKKRFLTEKAYSRCLCFLLSSLFSSASSLPLKLLLPVSIASNNTPALSRVVSSVFHCEAMTWAVLAFPVKCKHSIIYRVTRALTQIASFPNPLTPMHTKWFCKLKTLEELPDHKGRKRQEMALMLGES